MAEHPIAARAVRGSNPRVAFFPLLHFPLLWPSGLRRAVKVRISSEAQVRLLSTAYCKRGVVNSGCVRVVKELDLSSTGVRLRAGSNPVAHTPAP